MFGKKNQISIKINLSSYNRTHHLKPKCTGEFSVVLLENYIYTESVLGPIKLELAPAILCKKCGAEYLAPTFPKWLEREISKRIILSRGLLSKKQIKFLRLDFNFTQEELGKSLGLRKEQVAKMESESYQDHMSPDKQFRLKFHLAKILELKDFTKLHEEIDESELKTSKLIPSKKEIEQGFGLSKVA